MERRLIGLVGAVSIAMAGLASPAIAGDGEHVPAAAMRLVDARQVRIDDTRIISMSPDGRWLVAARPASSYPRGELCVYDVETLAERTCADLSPLGAGLRISDVTWSPDSRRLALAERSWEVFKDGDLWLMDAASGDLANLLDDGYSGNLIPVGGKEPPKGTVTIPANPAFSPDGRTIAFSRSFMVDGKPAGNDIATVPVEGGEPERVLLVSDGEPGVVHRGIRWSPDGSQLYYSLGHQRPDDARDGVRVVGVDGSGDRLVAGRYNPDGAAPAVLGLAADGEHLLVYDPSRFGYAFRGGLLATVAVADGALTPLVPLGADAMEYSSIGWAGFSPDGGALVTLRFPVQQAVISLQDVGASVEHPLDVDLQPDDGPILVGPIDMGIPFTWSPDGRLFLPGGARFSTGMLLTIAPGEVAP
jgi:Tol biopolymer transport system component